MVLTGYDDGDDVSDETYLEDRHLGEHKSRITKSSEKHNTTKKRGTCIFSGAWCYCLSGFLLEESPRSLMVIPKLRILRSFFSSPISLSSVTGTGVSIDKHGFLICQVYLYQSVDI